MTKIAQQRYTQAYNDMLGKLQSAQSGGTVWSIEPITNTSFVIGALASSNDTVQVTIQVPHTRQLNSILASIHIHYVLQAACTSGVDDIIKFTGSYVWIQPGDSIPASASWTAMTGADLTLTLGTKGIGYYNIHDIQHNISCPSSPNESYGGMLLISIVRVAAGNTYLGKLGILDVDAHSLMDRHGSELEASDS